MALWLRPVNPSEPQSAEWGRSKGFENLQFGLEFRILSSGNPEHIGVDRSYIQFSFRQQLQRLLFTSRTQITREKCSDWRLSSFRKTP